ncbi:MAG: sigma-70 family RNA polymerase sigma factor [Candidatus Omnitrophica bacterium]|nr:sigma-70 family RNA polymerase sigma factor [Candidatus Omnitrophota bacterium]
MSTEELLKKCIERDYEAWNDFIERYKSLVTRSVRYKLKKISVKMKMPRDEFRDIVQEIFLTIWEKNELARVRDAASLEGWLVMVSLNRTSNYCRGRIYAKPKNMVSLEADLFAGKPGISLKSMIPSACFNTVDMVESRELSELLKSEIDSLDHKQQLALKLNVYEHRKQKDISKIMNIPENTVATLVSRAKNRVREKMEEYFERNEGK